MEEHAPTVARPQPGEYAPYHNDYIGLVGTGEVVMVLADQIKKTKEALDLVPAEYSSFSYEDGKWTIAEVVGHLIDTERVMAFRALSFARGDKFDIPGMDQDQYVAESAYRNCQLADLVLEFEALRFATIRFFANLESDKWMRGGNASGQFVTVRALAYIIAGHELHHLAIIKDRYLDSPKIGLQD